MSRAPRRGFARTRRARVQTRSRARTRGSRLEGGRGGARRLPNRSRRRTAEVVRSCKPARRAVAISRAVTLSKTPAAGSPNASWSMPTSVPASPTPRSRVGSHSGGDHLVVVVAPRCDRGRRRRRRRTAGRRGPREPPSRAGGRGPRGGVTARARDRARGGGPPPGAPRASRPKTRRATPTSTFLKRRRGHGRGASRGGGSLAPAPRGRRARGIGGGRSRTAAAAAAIARRAPARSRQARARVVVPAMPSGDVAERRRRRAISPATRMMADQTATDGRGDRRREPSRQSASRFYQTARTSSEHGRARAGTERERHGVARSSAREQP